MPRDGKFTKNKILAESKKLVLKNGFSGTSIDQILEKTGITKGAFFYHFNTKNALAEALIEQYSQEDRAEMEKVLSDTESLKSDPLQRVIQFVQEYIDLMTDLNEPPAGCLYASYGNETNSFNAEIRGYIAESILLWRRTFKMMISDVLARYTTAIETDTESLADHFTVIIEGAFIVSRALNEPELAARQLKHFKNYLQLLFIPK